MLKHSPFFVGSLWLFIFLSFFYPLPVFAHLGGGPPFLKVNDKYCPTNLTYSGNTILLIPQDYAPATYLPKKNVTFALDLQNLSIPLDLLGKVTFRWSFYKGAYLHEQMGGYQYGIGISEIFPRSGSYLVKIEATVAGNDPVLLDTALVNVIPYKGYKIPAGVVQIRSDNFSPSEFVSFSQKPTFDKTSHGLAYFWDFGDGKLEKGQTVRKTFDRPDGYFYARVVDTYGLLADTEINMHQLNNKLLFNPMGYLTDASLVYGKVIVTQGNNSIEELQKQIVLLVIFFVILVCALLIAGIVIFKKRRRRYKNPLQN